MRTPTVRVTKGAVYGAAVMLAALSAVLVLANLTTISADAIYVPLGCALAVGLLLTVRQAPGHPGAALILLPAIVADARVGEPHGPGVYRRAIRQQHYPQPAQMGHLCGRIHQCALRAVAPGGTRGRGVESAEVGRARCAALAGAGPGRRPAPARRRWLRRWRAVARHGCPAGAAVRGPRGGQPGNAARRDRGRTRPFGSRQRAAG